MKKQQLKDIARVVEEPWQLMSARMKAVIQSLKTADIRVRCFWEDADQIGEADQELNDAITQLEHIRADLQSRRR